MGASRTVEFTVEIYKGIWVQWEVNLCQILLLAQTHVRAILPESDQTHQWLCPQLFSKSEIEFFISPDPIKEAKKLKTRTQVPNSWHTDTNVAILGSKSTELVNPFVAQMPHRPLILHKIMFWGCMHPENRQRAQKRALTYRKYMLEPILPSTKLPMWNSLLYPMV